MTNWKSSAAKTSDNQVQGAAILVRTSTQVARQTDGTSTLQGVSSAIRLAPPNGLWAEGRGTPTSVSAYAGLSDVDRERN